MQTRFRQTGITHRLIEFQRIDNAITCESIHHQTFLVRCCHFFGFRFLVQQAFVDVNDVLDIGQFPVQTRLGHKTARRTELQHDGLLCHVDGKCRRINHGCGHCGHNAKSNQIGLIH